MEMKKIDDEEHRALLGEKSVEDEDAASAGHHLNKDIDNVKQY